METVTVRMARGERNTSWGFGVTETPSRDVVIVNVVGGSLADRAGLRNGDIVDKLEGLDNLDINAVDRLLVTARDRIELIVHRSSGGQTRIWRPEITENPAMFSSSQGRIPPVEERPYKVNLQHNSDTVPPQGFNSPALPFNPDPRVKHLQYNSPMGMYSNANITESYVQQTAGIVDNARGPGGRDSDQPAYLRSETLRLLKEQEGGQRSGVPSLSSHPNPSGLPTCFVCTRPILGVMARAAGHEVHGDCLSCATCGNSLRNIGHHFIEGKFYCDIHGRQKKSLHAGSMDPNLAVRSSPSAAHPVRPTENVRAFYQPEVLSRKTLSPSPVPHHHVEQHTHYTNPKTHGTISPSNRGVPTNVTYTGDRQPINRTLSPQPRPIPVQAPPQTIPVQQAPPPQAPPPVPANPPPAVSEPLRVLPVPQQESRVPSSVRCAVSPRRSARGLRQWPPPPSLATNRYWQIDPAGQAKAEREEQPHSLQEIIEKEKERKEIKTEKREKQQKSRLDARRKTEIRMEQNQKPAIRDGIHWTVISGPKNEETSEIKVPVDSFTKHGEQNTSEVHIENEEKNVLKSYIVRSSAQEQQPNTESYIASNETLESAPTSYIERGPTQELRENRESDQPKTTSYIVGPPTALPSWQNTTASPAHQLQVHAPTTDSSTSPIPVITLGRNRQPAVFSQPTPCQQPAVPTSRLPCTSSPVPFAARSPPYQRVVTPPLIRVETKSPVEPSSTLIQGTGGLIGTNISPRPFVANTNTNRVLKRVDFSSVVPTVIPEPRWAEPDVVDEADILTDVSRISDVSREGAELKVNGPYDGDESEQCTVRSETTVDEYLEDEQEEWMREELELARKEELAMIELDQLRRREIEESLDRREQRENTPVHVEQERIRQEDREEAETEREHDRFRQKDRDEADTETEHDRIRQETQNEAETQRERRNSVPNEEREEWRQQAMELMNDEDQTERDFAIVAALNERLQGLREMEDADRQRAIECIERHQMNLEDQQEQLSSLLDSAIQYLRNLDAQYVPGQATPFAPPLGPAPPARLTAGLRTDSLSDALDELQSLNIPSLNGDTSQRSSRKSLNTSPLPINSFDIQLPHPVDNMGSQLPHPIDNMGGQLPYSVDSLGNGLPNTVDNMGDHFSQSINNREPEPSEMAGSDHLSDQLRRFEENGQTFSRSTFERSEKKEQNGARVEGRGQGALQNPGGRIPYCEACKQQIRGAFVLATGLAWCPEHFICANGRCGRRLLECGFVEENGQKYCEGCFEAHIAPRCAKCAKPIVSDCLNALQKKWHPTCFTCGHCQKPFGNSAFYLENGLPYCEKDWNQLFTTKCVSCKYAIEAGDRWVEALGSAFHSNCFNCTRCQANLEGESFFAKNGQPFCKMHA